MLERLFEAVRTFSQGTPQGDDITGLVLRYRGRVRTMATADRSPIADIESPGVAPLGATRQEDGMQIDQKMAGDVMVVTHQR